MKKSIFLVTATIALALVLAACSGTSSSDETTTPGAFGNNPGLGTPSTGLGTPSTGLGTPSTGLGTSAPTSGANATTPAQTSAATAETTKAAGTPSVSATEAMTATVGTGAGAAVNQPDPGRVNDLLKFEVWDTTGSKIGTGKNVILNFETNKVDYIVVSYGGTLGIGARQVAVPCELFKFPTASASNGTTTGTGVNSTPAAGANTPAAGASTPIGGGTPAAGSTPAAGASTSAPASNLSANENYITLTVPKSVLDNAPKFDSSLMPPFGQPAGQWDSQLKTYWSQNGVSGSAGGATGASSTPASTPAGGAINTPAAGGSSSTPAVGGTSTTPSVDITPGAVTTTAMSLQGVIMADKAIGMPMTNTNGDKIGDVKDIVIDTTNCSLQYLVVSYNGGTTAGTTLVPIPAAALQLSSDGQSFVVADETLLSSAPHFDTNAFPYTLTMDWDKDVKTFWSTHTKPSTP